MNAFEIKANFHPSLHLDTDFNIDSWRCAEVLAINYNWKGGQAPPELRTNARVLWNGSEITFGFECAYTELDIDQEFDIDEERNGLWDRDVCEAFIRSPLEPHEKIYKEFEVAPTGQWCDLKIDRLRMDHDWQWRSGMRTASEIIEPERIWRAAMSIPFDAFGRRPQTGETWYANLFRVSRLNGKRHYLALAPTFTEEPNFHIPESFVKLRFVR